MIGLNPRDLRRALKRMGIQMEDVNAISVNIELNDGSKLYVESPQVIIIRAKGQPPMIYVIGDIRKIEAEEVQVVSDEDVRLVMEQTGVSFEEAKKALEETGGDIAAAILRIQEMKS